MNEADLSKEFLAESYENLDQLDRALVVLEKDPTDRERLASIFRTIHTIKGSCGFLHFAKLEAVTHVGENLLSRLRDGRLLLNAEITSVLLALVDAVREMLARIASTGNDGDGDYTPLIALLTRLAGGEKCAGARSAERGAQEASALCALGSALPPPDPPAAPSLAATEASSHQPIAGKVGDILVKRSRIRPEDLAQALSRQESGDPRRLGEILAELRAVTMEDVLEALRLQAESRTSGVSESKIRVDVGLLDKLMTLAGELVLTRNQILQITGTQQDTTFASTCRRLNLITTELHEAIMKTRMQPIANVWNKLPRVVRDLALTCDKQVQINLEGKETELDKAVIEAIKDPLTHLVRNAVDHGIEVPEVRRARGKPAEGRLFLRAFHEGGQVNMEISDDGGGIDVAQIKQKALERALFTQEQADRMSGPELLHLIFLPGFSTADKATNLSGRGVGMDVVKTNVEKIGGTVDIQNQPGLGLTVKIKVPLTLALIPALIVTTGGDRYAIPQFSLLELVRLDGEQACRSIERIHTTPVYRWRGQLLPLVYLDRELKVRSKRSPAEDTVHIVVLQADDRQFGLVVDEANDTEEIVVKPLSKRLKRIPLFAGATIMGDGKVALILDVPSLAQCAGVISEVRHRGEKGTVPLSSEGQSSFPPPLADKEAESPDRDNARQTLLLLGLGPEHRLAIPLHLVTRLEEIPWSAVEQTARQEVVQYRGQILPLIRLAAALQSPSKEQSPFPPLASDDSEAPAHQSPLKVLVYSDRGRSFGLVVDRILDTVETAAEVRDSGRRPGILGSAVIQQRVTELLDLPAVVHAADLSLLELPHPPLSPTRGRGEGEGAAALGRG